MIKSFLVSSFLFFCVSVCCSQNQEAHLIQYSGVVISADSNAIPIPYASIFNRSIRMGTIANFQGFFSFAARVGDTIEVSSVGFGKGIVIVPDVPNNQGYTAIILLRPEIKTLPTAVVYPWFTKEQFREAFVHMNIPDDDLARAEENLNREKLDELGQFIADANINATRTFQNYANTYYYQGQYQPTPILSPTAWMQFFNMLKSGAFKKQ